MSKLRLAIPLGVVALSAALAASTVGAQQPDSGTSAGSAPQASPQPAQPETKPPAASPPAGDDRSERPKDRADRGPDRRSFDDYAGDYGRGSRWHHRGWMHGDDRSGDDGSRRGPPRDRGDGPPRDFSGPGPRGPMMMGAGAFRRLCGPGGERMMGFMLDRLERITRPTDAQRPTFDKLKEATSKARETVRAACPTEPPPITPPGRLAAAEKHLEALLNAVRTVRPALDAYYASLSEEQKARLYASRPEPRWRERSDRWHRDGWNGPRPDGNRQGWRYDEGRERREAWRDRDESRGNNDRSRDERWRNPYPDQRRQGWREDESRERREAWRERDQDRSGNDGSRDERWRGPRDHNRDGWPDSWGGRS